MFHDSLLKYRRRAIRAARDLKYGTEVSNKLKNAKTMDEVSSIMTKARKKAT